MDNSESNNEENIIIDVGVMDLKNKVTVTSGGINMNQIEKAEQIIANMSDSYIDWAMEDVGKLQSAYVQLIQDIDNYEANLKNIFEIGHDMKGQGGSFGYDLVTEVGNYLCRFIERIKAKPTPKILDVIKLHIDAIRIVLIGKIKGDGGAKGGKILEGLEATLQKYTPDLVENMHHLKEMKQAAEEAKIEKEKTEDKENE